MDTLLYRRCFASVTYQLCGGGEEPVRVRAAAHEAARRLDDLLDARTGAAARGAAPRGAGARDRGRARALAAPGEQGSERPGERTHADAHARRARQPLRDRP